MMIRAPALALAALVLYMSLRAPPGAALAADVPAVAESSSVRALGAPDHDAMLSDGQPPPVSFRWAPLVGYDSRRQLLTTRLALTSTLGSVPLLPGMLDLSLEGAVGSAGRRLDSAVGARIGMPWFGAGVEYDIAREHFAFALSMLYPLRRGGLFHRGEMPRIDYRPGRGDVQVGVSMPSPFRTYRITRRVQKEFRVPRGGSLRPAPDAPRALPAAAESALAVVDHCVLWIDRYTTPRFRAGDDFAASAAPLRAHARLPGHAPKDEERAYHRALDDAFAAVLGGDRAAGRAMALRAENILFTHVLAPFDAELGQEKEPPVAAGYCAEALATFDAELAPEPLLDPPGDPPAPAGRAACREVFRRVVASVERASLQARARWRDSFLLWNDHARLAWIPLHYGLRPEQYATQAGWDSVLARIAQQPFTGANEIQYLMMEQFHVELKRMLRETDRYQVTIVHDFRGFTSDGGTDVYGWDMVADGYVAAFVQAVRELDTGKRTRLPQFFLFLDEHYYQQNHEREILTHLENLYDAPPLELRNKDIAVQVEAEEDTLRDAVAHSAALAGLDAAQLRELLRVHVLVTNPIDPAFSLDVLRRDHRKIAFRDVSEADPAAGAAVITGQGVGEHYNGSGWEDRSILVRGSSLVQLKDATRALVLGQGYRDAEVPECLRPVARPDDYAARCARLRAEGWTTPVSFAMNETGYGHKGATALKAAMYDLAPDSSTVLAFDSLWLSDFWAGMFIGASLHGARMFAVAPSPINAPSSGAQVLYFMRQNVDLLFRAQEYFHDDLAAAHGVLRVGVYAHDVATSDFRRRGAAFLGGRADQPFLRELFPMDPGIDSLLTGFLAQFAEVPIVALKLRARPYLHLKFQFFASWEGMQILQRREWAPVLRQHLAIRQRQTFGLRSDGLTPRLLALTDPGAPASAGLIPAFERDLAARDPAAPGRVVYTTTIGSNNQNPRSLFLDGEVSVVVSGYDGLITAPDFVFILGITRWPTTQAELERLYPKQSLSPLLAPLRGFLKSQL